MEVDIILAVDILRKFTSNSNLFFGYNYANNLWKIFEIEGKSDIMQKIRKKEINHNKNRLEGKNVQITLRI